MKKITEMLKETKIEERMIVKAKDLCAENDFIDHTTNRDPKNSEWSDDAIASFIIHALLCTIRRNNAKANGVKEENMGVSFNGLQMMFVTSIDSNINPKKNIGSFDMSHRYKVFRSYFAGERFPAISNKVIIGAQEQWYKENLEGKTRDMLKDSNSEIFELLESIELIMVHAPNNSDLFKVNSISKPITASEVYEREKYSYSFSPTLQNMLKKTANGFGVCVSGSKNYEWSAMFIGARLLASGVNKGEVVKDIKIAIENMAPVTQKKFFKTLLRVENLFCNNSMPYSDFMLSNDGAISTSPFQGLLYCVRKNVFESLLSNKHKKYENILMTKYGGSLSEMNPFNMFTIHFDYPTTILKRSGEINLNCKLSECSQEELDGRVEFASMMVDFLYRKDIIKAIKAQLKEDKIKYNTWSTAPYVSTGDPRVLRFDTNGGAAAASAGKKLSATFANVWASCLLNDWGNM